MFTCEDRNNTCVERHLICDGKPDCHNWKDEKNCSEVKKILASPQHRNATAATAVMAATDDADFAVTESPSLELTEGDTESASGEAAASPKSSVAVVDLVERKDSEEAALASSSAAVVDLVERKDSEEIDGERDVEIDGLSDEQQNPNDFGDYGSCSSWKMFSCDSSELTCVPFEVMCDGSKDCLNGADEANCSSVDVGKLTCEERDLYSCGDRFDSCIDHSLICNGDADCENDRDEAGCVADREGGDEWEVCDLSDSFICSGGMHECVKKVMICDGYFDCPEGDDEKGCTGIEDVDYGDNNNGSGNGSGSGDSSGDYIYKVDCDEHDFYCVSEPEVCFSRDNVCDGVPNCIDDSDEKNCSYPQTTTAIPLTTATAAAEETTVPDSLLGDYEYGCPSDVFQCNDGLCIDPVKICDGIGDCDGFEDEIDCDGDVVENTTTSTTAPLNNSTTATSPTTPTYTTGEPTPAGASVKPQTTEQATTSEATTIETTTTEITTTEATTTGATITEATTTEATTTEATTTEATTIEATTTDVTTTEATTKQATTTQATTPQLTTTEATTTSGTTTEAITTAVTDSTSIETDTPESATTAPTEHTTKDATTETTESLVTTARVNETSTKGPIVCYYLSTHLTLGEVLVVDSCSNATCTAGGKVLRDIKVGCTSGGSALVPTNLFAIAVLLIMTMLHLHVFSST